MVGTTGQHFIGKVLHADSSAHQKRRGECKWFTGYLCALGGAKTCTMALLNIYQNLNLPKAFVWVWLDRMYAPSANQKWTWKIPIFADDFPFKCSIAGDFRLPCLIRRVAHIYTGCGIPPFVECDNPQYILLSTVPNVPKNHQPATAQIDPSLWWVWKNPAAPWLHGTLRPVPIVSPRSAFLPAFKMNPHLLVTCQIDIYWKDSKSIYGHVCI